MNQFRALLLRSTDVGKNWSYLSTIAAGPMGQEGFNYTSPSRRIYGRMIDVKRR